MIAQDQFINPDDQVEVPNPGILADFAPRCIDYAQSDAYVSTNPVTEKEPVTPPLKKRRQQSDAPEDE